MCNDELKIELCAAYAKHRLDFLSNYKEVKVVVIPEIPAEFALFPDSQTDYWRRIDTEDGTLACVYRMAPRGVFMTHRHYPSKEVCKILTPGAKVEWITERKISFHECGEEFSSLKGEKHALVSHVDFPIDIEVRWDKGMREWTAIFETVEEK